MTRTDRRSVLTGFGAIGLGAAGAGLAGCDSRTEEKKASDVVVAAATDRPTVEALDLSTLERLHGGRLGLAVTSPAGDRRFAWRGDERFLYCSTFKLFLAAATLQRVTTDDERLLRPIRVTERDMVPHAPTTGPAVGQTLTVEQLCQAMVELSDNPAANILIREFGGLDAWRAWYAGIGDAVTRVDRLEPGLNQPSENKDTTTPLQAVANIDYLFGDATKGLAEPFRTQLERWLKDSPTGENRIKAGVPNGYRVGHKTGTSGGGQANDIGLIWPASGPPSSIAIYYEATAASTPATRDIVIAAATRLALEALDRGEAA